MKLITGHRHNFSSIACHGCMLLSCVYILHSTHVINDNC